MSAASGRVDPSFPPALTALGFNARWSALLADVSDDARALRVIRDDRGAVLAAGEGEAVRLATPADVHPVTGDWLAVSDDRILAVLDRSSAVVRPRPAGDSQTLAANVDIVGVVHGMDRPLNHRRLERGLVIGWESGAMPLIILTKADLAQDVDAVVREAAAAGPGVDVVAVSNVDGRGLDDVLALLQPNLTAVLIGASGAGKSSLINALVGDQVLATGEVRAVDGKGKHTTSRRELVALPGGGLMIDTPGLRALAIGVTDEGIGLAFPEVDKLAPECRFHDCSHVHEPGCAVKAAVENGTFAADRYDGWLRVLRESDSARLRADPLLLRQHNRQWGRIIREASRVKRDTK